MAEVFSTDGQKIGTLDNSKSDASHILVKGGNTKEGFWKIVFKTIKGSAIIALDDQLPQWFITDPAHPIRIKL